MRAFMRLGPCALLAAMGCGGTSKEGQSPTRGAPAPPFVASTPAARRHLPWPQNFAPELPVVAAPVLSARPALPAPASLPRPKLLWRRHFAELDAETQLLPEPTELGSGNREGSVALEWAPYAGLLLDLKTGQDRPAASGTRQPAPPPSEVSFRVQEGVLHALSEHRPGSAPLWVEADAGTGDEPFARPVYVGHSVFVLTAHALLKRHAQSGKLLGRWVLPDFLEPYVRERDVDVLANEERCALLVGSLDPQGLVLTARRTGRSLDILDRPMVSAQQQLLIGDTLVLFDARSDTVGAYDLGARAAPIAAYAPEQALLVLSAEMVVDGDGLCERTWGLPGFDERWLAIAGDPKNPLWHCALSHLEQQPTPAGFELSRRLVQEPGKLDAAELSSVVKVLANDDQLETSRVLSPLARQTDDRPWYEADDAARAQLWRTGRTSELGLCRPTEQLRHVAALAPPASGAPRDIGTRHPLLLQALAPDGRWSIICQARADSNRDGRIELSVGRHGDAVGDVLRQYLVLQSGPGWEIEELIATDPAGRYLAVREGACLSLVDTERANVLQLPNADLRDNGRIGPHRGAAFDARGTQLVYVRAHPQSDEIVVRQLATGKERALQPGAGRVWRASFAGAGDWLEVEMLPSGEWPSQRTTLAPRQCRGSVASASFFGHTGPELELRLISLHDGSVREASGALGVFDDQLLVRHADGALALRSTGAVDNIVVPATCGAKLLLRDSSRQLLLVACNGSDPEAPKVEVPLWLVQPEGTLVLGEISAPSGDRLRESVERFVRVLDVAIDLDARERLPELPRAPGRARIIEDHARFSAGELAERADGAVLVQPPALDLEVPRGPLRWRPATR